jgi:hypothetical protein
MRYCHNVYRPRIVYTDLRFYTGWAKSGRSKGREEMKKRQGQLVKESFTKSFGQRYAEMSKSEKVGYSIFGFVVVTIMYLLWNSG